MARKKTAKTQPSKTNITVKGNVTGNIVVGSENSVSQRSTSIIFQRIGGIIIFIALLIILPFAWKFFLPARNTILVTPTVTPLPPEIWEIEVFDNISLNGSPVFVFTQSAQTNSEGGYEVAFTPHGLRQQVSGMPANNYSLRLVGTFEFQEGYFEFHCEHHDGCRIYIDGYNWIDAWWDGGGGHDLARNLLAGVHVVVIEFYDKSGYGLLEVRWKLKPSAT